MSSQKKSSPKPLISGIPSAIRIFGKVVAVRQTEMPKGEFGEYHQHECRISISNKLSESDARMTLFHECLHAALHISGLSNIIPGPIDSTDNTPDLEEAIVTCLENALYEMVDLEKIRVDIK